MPKPLMSHRCNTKREGIGSFIWSTLTLMGFIGFTQYFFPDLRKKDPTFFYIYYGFIFGIGGFMIFGYAIPNIFMNREFRFELFEDRIECKSPVKAFGESYSILLSDIVELEKRRSSNSSNWYIVTRDEREICITPNYGNPVVKIVKELQRLNPKMPVKHV